MPAGPTAPQRMRQFLFLANVYMTGPEFIILFAAAMAVIILQVVILLTGTRGGELAPQLLQILAGLERGHQQRLERLECEGRWQMQRSELAMRVDLGGFLAHFLEALAAQLS